MRQRLRFPPHSLALVALLVAVIGGCRSLTTPLPAQGPFELVFIGQQIVPFGYTFQGTIVGGLSGIDYDAATGRYWTLSDDRSEHPESGLGRSRFYEIALDLSRFTKSTEPGFDGVRFHSVATLKRPDGTTFPSAKEQPGRAADPESIRVHVPSGRLVWSSEGERTVEPNKPVVLEDPHVWEMERDGRFIRAFAIPDKFRASATRHGIRDNLAFEGVAFAPDYSTLFAATENALLQDGPQTSFTEASPSRVIEFDYASGKPRGEFVVEVSPIPFRPEKPGGFADNGIAEILTLDVRRLLVLERSYVDGVGITLRLFSADLRDATDVSAFDSLVGQQWKPAQKSLLLDFKTIGVRLDNVEGMTWGPRLPNGNRTLVLLSDNNFRRSQITQFLAFEVRER